MRHLAKYLCLAAILGMIAFACTETPEPLQTPSTSGLFKSAMDGDDDSGGLGDPSITIAPGTGLAAGGAGLRDEGTGQPGTINVTVPGGATVEQVLIYWEGHNATESGDNQITVDGYTVTADGGMPIGGPTEFWDDNWSSSWRADITSYNLISDGANSVSVSGMDFLKNNGAGILVIYDDGSNDEVVGIKDGNDLAYWGFDPPLDATVAQTFDFAAAPDDRMATLVMFASSVEAGRPNLVRYTVGGNPTQVIANPFASNDGRDWDTFVKDDLLIPAGETSLTVQAFSEDPDAVPGSNPASFAWIVGALVIEGVEEIGCRVTGGCNDDYDGDVYTCGGQAGAPLASQPQPWGEWTHTQKRGPSGSFTFHAGTASAPPGTEIDWIECMDPGWCRQARPAPAKQIDFAGVGTFKNMKPNVPPSISDHVVVGETFHWFEVNIDDLGEPGKAGKVDPPAAECDELGYGRNGGEVLANCECPDFYRIRIYRGETDSSPVMYEVFGYIDGGNFQIHPPTGRDRKTIED